jgi:Transposase zinc-binding domain
MSARIANHSTSRNGCYPRPRQTRCSGGSLQRRTYRARLRRAACIALVVSFATCTRHAHNQRGLLDLFICTTETESGSALPEFVKAEFEAFLACGILAHGFLRLRCSECGHEKLVAFSCKRRGFCPSCGARRMAETAAHLGDCVIPPVPVRQWVLSLPIPLRLLLAAQPQLLAPLLQAIHRVIAGFLVKRAGFKLSRADTGAVTLIQRLDQPPI